MEDSCLSPMLDGLPRSKPNVSAKAIPAFSIASSRNDQLVARTHHLVGFLDVLKKVRFTLCGIARQSPSHSFLHEDYPSASIWGKFVNAPWPRRCGVEQTPCTKQSSSIMYKRLFGTGKISERTYACMITYTTFYVKHTFCESTSGGL
jgi:hypothetical protein